MGYGAILNKDIDINNYYTKEESLSESTRVLLGLSQSDNLDDALQALYLKNTGGNLFGLTVLWPNGDPAANLTLGGVTNINDGIVTTNEDGYALVKATTGTPTVTATSPYIDISNLSQQLNKDSNLITNVTVYFQGAYSSGVGLLIEDTSASYDISPYCTTADISMISGGNGGARGVSGTSDRAGDGGNGGYVLYNSNVQIASRSINKITVNIGEGGVANSGEGGMTFVYLQNNYSTIQVLQTTSSGQYARGGTSYSDDRPNGEDCPGFIHNDYTLPASNYWGGAGGCGQGEHDSHGIGGNRGGGEGRSVNASGSRGSAPGAGGGGGYGTDTRRSDGYDGHAGGVYIRFHH